MHITAIVNLLSAYISPLYLLSGPLSLTWFEEHQRAQTGVLCMVHLQVCEPLHQVRETGQL